MNHSATKTAVRVSGFFCAVFCLVPLAVGEEQSRACKAVAQLAQAPGCRVTECRMGGLSTVLLGAEEGPRYETRGDLILVDHECDAKLKIPDLFNAQQIKMKESGFALEGQALVQENFGAMVVQKDGHWLELTALLLEGAPTLSIRSVRTDSKGPRPRVIEPAAVSVTQSEPVLSVPAVPVVAKPEPTPVISAAPAPAAPPASDGPAPKIVSQTDGVLPAGFDGATATVTVEVVIDEKGSIARILSTQGNPALLGAALQTVRNWTFEPALVSGKPVSGVLQLAVRFKKK